MRKTCSCIMLSRMEFCTSPCSGLFVALHLLITASYGMMYRDLECCRAVYAGVPKGVKIFGLAGTFHEQVAKELGLPFVAELYGDVKYNSDGTLKIDRKKE